MLSVSWFLPSKYLVKQQRHLVRTPSAMDYYHFTSFSTRLLFWGLVCSAIIFEGIYAEERSDGCHVFKQEAVSTSTQEFTIKASKNYVFKSMELLKKFSFQPCVRNVMYGHSLTSWWVRYGCAGEFKLEECPMHDCIINYRNGSSPHLIPRVHLATKGYYIRMINVVEQTSFYSCEQGSTYHHNESMWWLDQGCEGMFQILECPITPRKNDVTVFKFTNGHSSATLAPKGIIHQVHFAPVTSKHIPTTTKATPSTTTNMIMTTTISIKKSTMSPRQEVNKIATDTDSKEAEINIRKTLTEHDSDDSEEEFPKRQVDEDGTEYNLANSGKANSYLLLLSIFAVLKSSHICSGLN